MHKRIKFRLILVVILTGSAILYFYFSRNTIPVKCPEIDFNSKSPIFKLPLDKPFFAMEIEINDLNSDQKPDFILTQASYYDPDKPPSIFIAMSSNDNTYKLANISGNSYLEHPRQIQVFDLNQDGLLDLLVADHGPDATKASGGKPKIFLQNQDHSFSAYTLDLPNRFYFNIQAFRYKSKTYMLLNSVTTEADKSLLVFEYVKSKATDHKQFELKSVSIKLPNPYGNFCYMTSTPIQTEPEPSWILGGCDNDIKNIHRDAHDLVITWPSDDTEFWKAEAPNALQRSDDSWGTAFLKKFQDSETQSPVFVRLTHNHGFTVPRANLMRKDLNNNWHISKNFYEPDIAYTGYLHDATYSPPYLNITFRYIKTNNDPIDWKLIPSNYIFQIQPDFQIKSINQCIADKSFLTSGRLLLSSKNQFFYFHKNTMYQL